MAWHYRLVHRLLHFLEPAGTSRGVYTTRDAWYVVLSNDAGRYGVGECAPLPDLSCDAGPDYEERLDKVCQDFCASAKDGTAEGAIDAACPENCPSMRFGLETALLHYEKGSVRFYDTPFSRGEKDIPINGLVWMGNHEKMLERMEAKLAKGFRCLKFKIGGIDFESECDLLERVRALYPDPCDLELRLDANGSFNAENAMDRLERLAKFQPHSLEQPVRQGNWQLMADLCKNSPVPLALDEELIGVTGSRKKDLVETIRPAYLVIKPSLHGGIRGMEEWIALADAVGVGHWVTSALESNIGLNAIAQWLGREDPVLPQGLGTGQLFADNCELMPAVLRGAAMHCDPAAPEPDLASWLGLNDFRTQG